MLDCVSMHCSAHEMLTNRFAVIVMSAQLFGEKHKFQSGIKHTIQVRSFKSILVEIIIIVYFTVSNGESP